MLHFVWWLWAASHSGPGNGKEWQACLGIKSRDFSEELTVGRRGEGDVGDGIQVSGFYSQWVMISHAEMRKDGGLLCLGNLTWRYGSRAQRRGLWLGRRWKVGSRGVPMGDPHQKHLGPATSPPSRSLSQEPILSPRILCLSSFYQL